MLIGRCCRCDPFEPTYVPAGSRTRRYCDISVNIGEKDHDLQWYYDSGSNEYRVSIPVDAQEGDVYLLDGIRVTPKSFNSGESIDFDCTNLWRGSTIFSGTNQYSSYGWLFDTPCESILRGDMAQTNKNRNSEGLAEDDEDDDILPVTPFEVSLTSVPLYAYTNTFEGRRLRVKYVRPVFDGVPYGDIITVPDGQVQFSDYFVWRWNAQSGFVNFDFLNIRPGMGREVGFDLWYEWTIEPGVAEGLHDNYAPRLSAGSAKSPACVMTIGLPDAEVFSPYDHGYDLTIEGGTIPVRDAFMAYPFNPGGWWGSRRDVYKYCRASIPTQRMIEEGGVQPGDKWRRTVSFSLLLAGSPYISLYGSRILGASPPEIDDMGHGAVYAVYTPQDDPGQQKSITSLRNNEGLVRYPWPGATLQSPPDKQIPGLHHYNNRTIPCYSSSTLYWTNAGGRFDPEGTTVFKLCDVSTSSGNQFNPIDLPSSLIVTRKNRV